MFEFQSDDRFRQQIIDRLFQLRLVAAVNSAVTSFLLYTVWSADALSLWSAATAGAGHVNTPLGLDRYRYRVYRRQPSLLRRTAGVVEVNGDRCCYPGSDDRLIIDYHVTMIGYGKKPSFTSLTTSDDLRLRWQRRAAAAVIGSS